MDIRVVANELRTTSSDEEHRLHRAALEWSLAEPIIINSADDIKSRVDWKGKVNPFHHQVQNLMRFCRRLPVTLLADDVGLGKTISAGLIVSELMKRRRVAKVFVVCPKILIPQWVEELDSKFGISAYGAVGSELRNSHNRAESVIITTYQSATKFLQRQESGLFDMLILDEAHKVRNLHGTQNPPKMAQAIFGALSARMFKYVLMLTATPIQNRLWDMYSLIDCLAVARGHKNPFGSAEQFSRRFIADRKDVARRLNQTNAEEFRNIVNSYMFRTRRIDANLAFPDRKVQSYAVSPDFNELQLQRLIGRVISDFSSLLQSSILVALMSSPQALALQLKNMARKGTVDQELADSVDQLVRRIPVPAKADKILKIAEGLRKQRGDWRMVVFTTRTETQAMLGKVFDEVGIAYGFISGGQPTANRRTIERFRAKSPEINVVVSTDAGAEGVNLQSANILINYDLPWNPMIVEQRIGRVQRIGSNFKNVWVANVVHQNSPEQHIVGRLMEKLQVISHTVGDIESVLEATNDANGDTFEKQIREMVVASLQGQNREEAARLAEKSIEDAKRLIEQNEEELDRTLGSSDDTEATDVPMPKLEPLSPSVPLQEFVLSTFRAEGAVVSQQAEGLYVASSPRLSDERFTFDETVFLAQGGHGYFHGRRPQFYQPGKPAFERLVQRWLDRGAAKIRDNRISLTRVKELATEWLASVPNAKLVESRSLDSVTRISGKLVCRTRVENSVDSYEKLLELDIPNSDSSAGSDSEFVNVRELLPTLDDQVKTSSMNDSEIKLFVDFYKQRLTKELEKTDSGDRRKKLVNDLEPRIVIEASAVDGELFGNSTIVVAYKFNSNQVYRSHLSVDGTGIIGGPERELCEKTDQLFPVDCLETCQASGKRCLREELEPSEASGELALPEHFESCSETGKRIHSREVSTCSVSRKTVFKGLMRESEMSGRWALAKKCINCELTGALILEDECVKSSISGKSFRCDEKVEWQDDQVAHASELTKCYYSGQYLPNEQMTVSDVTKMPLAKERQCFSEETNRKGDQIEIVTCELTGQKLLSDEVNVCAVTGKTISLQNLRTCPETNKVVNENLLQTCEASGSRVLPEALEKCCVSRNLVCKSLLGKSGLSGKKCLLSRLVRCYVSGIDLLPDEVCKEDLRGQTVDKRLVRRCFISGKSGLKTDLAKSRVTGKYMLPEYAVTLPNGTIVGPGEVQVCTWSRRYFETEKTGKCVLCGLIFDQRLLNEAGEFSLLKECLDGKQKGFRFPNSLLLTRLRPTLFTGVKNVRGIASESNRVHILFGKKSFFRLGSTKSFAVLAEGTGTKLRPVGKAVFGVFVNGTWQLAEAHSI